MSSQTVISAAPVFPSIVCGVDARGPSLEAARQAALLTPGTLSQVSVGNDAARELVEIAADHDLLVVGIDGYAMGNVARAALHRSPVPVLIARRPPYGVEFPERILLAGDGAATRLAARIAAQHGSQVAIAGARDGEGQIREATGAWPVIFDLPGPPYRAVAHAARAFEAALVITGVSEPIAHAAPCSVLVARY